MPDWQEAIRRLEQLKQDVGTITGNEMVNYALDNIRKESWEGKHWAARKPNSARNTNRGLLVDTGEGRRSIRVLRSSPTRTELTANDYMQAHNEGVHKTVSVRSRKGKNFSRKMNLPQRQFTGKSDAQTERIEKVIANRIIKALT